jgi:predicted amidohydrolase
MNKKTLKIAVVQPELRDRDWKYNLNKIEALLTKVSGNKAELAILPELWPSAMRLDNCGRQAEINSMEILPRIKEFTIKSGMWIHWGSMLHKEGKDCYNRAVLISPKGEIKLSYKKIHLFGLMGEDKYIAPGKEMPLAELPFAKVASGVCYDLRFPELFRYYALSGAEIIFLPAEWPHPRLNHWRLLLQARAVENQVFMVASNRTGIGGKYRFFGHSMIVDPWGEIIFEADEEERAEVVEIDLSGISSAKGKLNTVNDVSPHIFDEIVDNLSR